VKTKARAAPGFFMPFFYVIPSGIKEEYLSPVATPMLEL